MILPDSSGAKTTARAPCVAGAKTSGDVSAPSRLYLALLVAVVGISCSAPLVKLASAPAATIAAYRLLFTVALLSPMVVRGHLPELRQIGWRNGLWCIAAGVFLAAHFIAWFTSLYYTSIASSVTLATLQPLFAFAGGFVLFNERLGWRAAGGALLSVAGGIIIGWGDFRVAGGALFGDALALSGAALATGYFFCGHSVRRHLSLNAYTYTVYASAAAVLFVYCAALQYPLSGFSVRNWWLFLAMAVLPTLLGHSLLNWSVRWVSVTAIAMVMLCEPIGASAIAYGLFGTVPRLNQYIGGAAAVAGIFVFMRYSRTRSQRMEAQAARRKRR